MEVVDEADPIGELGRQFLENSESEIFEDRHRFRERDEAAAAVHLEPKLARRISRDARDADVAIGVI